jgi:hypothetical protein
MDQVPVWKSIAHAYGFLFRRLPAIVGLSWLPAVFYAGAAYLCLARLGNVTSMPHNSASLYSFLDVFALFVATAFCSAAIGVALSRAAMADSFERVGIYFVFGKREWRLFTALLSFYAITAAVLLGVTLVCGLAIVEAATHLRGAEWFGLPAFLILDAGFAALGILLFVLLTVRYGFLLAADAAMDGRPGPGRNAAMIRGNFWRTLAVFLGMAAPAYIALTYLELAFGGGALGDAFGAARTGAAISFAHPDVLAAIWAGALVVFNALFAGASSVMYEHVAAAADAHQAVRVEDFEPTWAPVAAAAVPISEPHAPPAPAESVWTPPQPEQPHAEASAAHAPEAAGLAEEVAHAAPAETPAEVATTAPAAHPDHEQVQS